MCTPGARPTLLAQPYGPPLGDILGSAAAPPHPVVWDGHVCVTGVAGALPPLPELSLPCDVVCCAPESESIGVGGFL